jgi:single-stranded DNA-binding protein
MNQFIFTGRFVKDPETRYIPQEEKYVANFTVAQNIGKKKEDGTKDSIFFECSSWNEYVIKLVQTAVKGQRVTCTAKIIPKKWKDKNDLYQSKITILVSEIEIYD